MERTDSRINHLQRNDISPEKAGVGGSIPSLATIPQQVTANTEAFLSANVSKLVDDAVNFDNDTQHLLGVMNGIVGRFRLGEYSQDEARDSISHFMDRLIQKYRSAIGLDKRPKRRRVVEAVYVMRGSGQLYKIGRTKKLRSRQSSLQSANGSKVTLVLSRRIGLRASQVERHLHKLFDTRRVRGEWFSLTDEDVQSIPAAIENFLRTQAGARIGA